MKRAVVMLMVIMFGSTSVTTLALLPVHDPISNELRILEHIESLAKWAEQLSRMREQIDQFNKHWDYEKLIHGSWKLGLPHLPDKAAIFITNAAQNIRFIGWGGRDPFVEMKETKIAVEALDKLRRVMDAKSSSSDFGGLKDAIETVYGDAPVTEQGIVVEAAHREIGQVTVYTGQLQAALIEKRKNIDTLKAQIEAGGLAPGDLERKMVILEAERADADLIIAQTMNNSNRLAIHQLGLAANNAGNLELQRLKDRVQRLNMMGHTNFGLVRPERPRGIE